MDEGYYRKQTIMTSNTTRLSLMRTYVYMCMYNNRDKQYDRQDTEQVTTCSPRKKTNTKI